MKYCKICKTAAKDTETVCAKGHPLSVFGAKPTAGGGAGGGTTVTAGGGAPVITFALQGQVQALEDARKRNLVFGRGLGLLSLLILLAILFILYQIYARSVLDYAVLKNIRFVQDPVSEQRIIVRYDVVKPGKIVFDRRSGTGRTEKLDVINQTGSRSTDWSWPSDKTTGIDFRVGYRDGWFRASEKKHFDVTRDAIGVEVVFLMDVTSSMQASINGLKLSCHNFADQVRKQGIDCRLGLIAFGDLQENEPILTFPMTADVKEFQDHVEGLELTGGGDPPESSVEAIEKALEMKFRPHTRICFVHITDASCHNTERIPALAAILKEREIVTYVLSNQRYQRLYSPLCVNGGSFYGLHARFEDILDKLAQSLVNQINSD
jgi:Mg-chelatase subunit ChlD